jgi:hypothetical protein
MIRYIVLAVLVAATLLPGTGNAVTQQGVIVMKKWALSDKCAQSAQRAFPDYTAEALAKRDQALKRCLDIQNLPSRELSPDQ